MDIQNIKMQDYHYDLPDHRIARYPAQQRDSSRLLLYDKGAISEDVFINIDRHIPSGSLLVFNNTKVIRARLLFTKESGSPIEILCLEPSSPSAYEISLGSKDPVEWKCLVGNLKKWKHGVLRLPFSYQGTYFQLTAERIGQEGEVSTIIFSWNCGELTFGEVTEIAGHIPLPPYIDRKDEPEDIIRYQTVYSAVKGSVASPTAGLHFTDQVFNRLRQRKVETSRITLHVGAGTFRPVKSEKITDHDMHSEHFTVTYDLIEQLKQNRVNVICVGTTTVRTLESLYWTGVRLTRDKNRGNVLHTGQWDPYGEETDIPVEDSMNAIQLYLKANGLIELKTSTSIIIVPGYKFRMMNGMITNFHQPGSTLLLLIAAWIGNDWKKVYDYALMNDFRFLSYGDSSLLIR